MTPEKKARVLIDQHLLDAGWIVPIHLRLHHDQPS